MTAVYPSRDFPAVIPIGYSSPEGGVYRDVSRIDGAGSVGPAAFPDVTLPLAEIFA